MSVENGLRSGMPLSYNVDKASEESGLYCDPAESMTQQQFKEDSDINEIVRRFGLTGQLPDNPRPPQYGDFTTISDFQTAMNAVRSAEEGFMEFPAELRARFHNSPQEMLVFLSRSENRDEAIKLGLVAKPPETTRPPEPEAPPAA